MMMVLSLPPPPLWLSGRNGTRFSGAPPLPGSWLTLSIHMCYCASPETPSHIFSGGVARAHRLVTFGLYINVLHVVLFLPSDGISLSGPNRSPLCPGSCTSPNIHTRSRTIYSIMSGPPPIPPNVQEFAAPQLLGGTWNWFLYGALVVQFYVYSYNFPRDNKYIKLLVYSVFFLETLQTALSGADLYYWFASGFGNVERLTTPYISFFDVPILGSVVSLCVQFFFVYRIWVLSKKRWWWLCALICLFSTVDAVAAFAGGTYTRVKGEFASGRILKIVALTWLSGNTISDLLIASAMLFHLRRLKAREGNLSSHALVSIVRLTVETNVVTTTVSIVSLLMVAVYPDKNWFVCPTYVLGKLYSNTLLVSLNNRIAIRDTSSARGAVEVEVAPSSTGRSETTADFLLLESEKHQKETMKYPQALAEVQVVSERVSTIV